jgi:mono/diheme cytochrome c family protein
MATHADGSIATPSGRPDGAALFVQYCAICHGMNGDGNGPAAPAVDPRPRDFRLGKYRLVSSGNSIPFKQDIVRTIRNGMPGTSMPSWVQLPDEQIDALADYVWNISRKSERERIAGKLLAQKRSLKNLDMLTDARTTPDSPAKPGPEPAVTPESLAKAKALFDVTCAKCHGADGTGMQDPAWRTDEGLPIASRNFRSGVFKGGPRGQDIYLRIYGGMPGTPMPAFSSFSDADVWNMVHYVQTVGGPTPAMPSSGNQHLTTNH